MIYRNTESEEVQVYGFVLCSLVKICILLEVSVMFNIVYYLKRIRKQSKGQKKFFNIEDSEKDNIFCSKIY